MKHTPWMDKTPRERFEALAWSVSVSCAIESGEDPQVIYERMMERNKEKLNELKEDLEGTEH